MTVIESNPQTFSLAAGLALTVTADANSSGTVYRLGDHMGDPSQTTTAIAASSSTVFGPFNTQTIWRVVANAGQLEATQGAASSAQVAAGAGALVYKGALDCSANPNWPAANAGDVYKVSVAGKVGGASGKTVQVGDVLTCNITGNAGTDASVGANWMIEQGNVVSTADVPASTNKNYVTDAQQTVIAATAGVNTGDQRKRSFQFVYDFSVLGGTQGTIVLTQFDGAIPNNLVIQNSFIDVITPLGSAGLALAAVTSGQGAGDLVVAAAFSGPPFSTTGPKVTIPLLGMIGTWIKTSASRSPAIVITIADLNAGKFNLFIEGFVSA